AAGAPVSALAQVDRAAAETQIKAAFLYKFSGFVEWPPKAFTRPESPFTIGVIGADELAAELEQIVKGRTVLERAVVVRRMRRGESVAGIQMLFIGQAEGARPMKSIWRSEEHTSELQSLAYLVCRLLLEKKKKQKIK